MMDRWGMLVLMGCAPVLAAAGAEQPYKQGPRDQITRIARGETVAALQYWEQYLAEHPHDLEAHYGLAICYAQAGELPRAVEMARAGVAQGLPLERFLAGPRELLRPLTDSEPFRAWVAPQRVELLHGPALGALTDTSVNVWVRTWHEVPVEVQVWRSANVRNGSAPAVAGTARAVTRGQLDYTAVLHVTGLQPDTAYAYRLIIDTAPQPETFTFRTPPAAGTAARFTVVFGGGAGYTPQHERMWDVIRSHAPLAYMALGDNVYIDTPKVPATQQYCYYRRQSRPEYRRLVSTTAVFAIWDDHDFCVNDGEGGPEIERPVWKRRVWETFCQNFANPAYGGGPSQPGCWFQCTLADVDFFLIDGRYYRSRQDATMLGPVQKQWLFQALKKSTATFKVLCSDVPVAPGVKPGSRDPWDGFPEERAELFQFLAENRIDGVFVIAADRHRSDAWKIERAGSYPIYEFQSSRLTNVHRHPIIDGCLFGYNAQCSFGRLTFDTTRDDPQVTCDVINIDNELVHSLTIRRSELTSRP